MKLNARSRSAVMALVDLAYNDTQRVVPLKDMAARQGLSVLYLEQLFAVLKRKGLVGSVRGPGGGYFLNEDAEKISVGRIIQALNDPIQITRCKGSGRNGTGCLANKALCATHHLWENLEEHIWKYLHSVTLKDITGHFAATHKRGHRVA